MTSNQIHKLFFFVLLIIFIFLAFNKHSRSGYFNYHSQIYGDKAGYYMYLPATFNYNFQAKSFPDSIDFKTGTGFRLDTLNNKVTTKYTYGTALMQLPFYLVANSLAEAFDYKKDGFSPIYQKTIDIAAAVYLVFGLYLLSLFLSKKYGYISSSITVLLVVSGTNLFYYSIDETGMTHVYSFFLLSLLLYLSDKTNYFNINNAFYLFLLGLIMGLSIVVRPINLILLAFVFFIDINNKSELLERIRVIFHPKRMLFFILGGVIISVPQFLYWNYLSGSPLFYSYENEFFTWFNPETIKLWFSPNNGLFIYTPFYLVIIACIVYYIKAGNISGRNNLLLFIVMSYILSCWWSWHFGCSFGARNFIDQLPLHAIPLAFVVDRIIHKRDWKFYFAGFLVVSMIYYNIKLSYVFDECYYGSNDWDWEYFSSFVKAALL